MVQDMAKRIQQSVAAGNAQQDEREEDVEFHKTLKKSLCGLDNCMSLILCEQFSNRGEHSLRR
jgi:hypothetical protein